jgi:hypothetical protein
MVESPGLGLDKLNARLASAGKNKISPFARISLLHAYILTTKHQSILHCNNSKVKVRHDHG